MKTLYKKTTKGQMLPMVRLLSGHYTVSTKAIEQVYAFTEAYKEKLGVIGE